jgi:hypothetical protein
MKEIGNFFARLSSRKFLLTVGGIIAVTLYPEGAAAICTLIATFTAAEGAADAVSRYAVEKTKQNNISVEHDRALLAGDDDDEITGVITPGNTSQSTTTPTTFGGDAPL